MATLSDLSARFDLYPTLEIYPYLSWTVVPFPGIAVRSSIVSTISVARMAARPAFSFVRGHIRRVDFFGGVFDFSQIIVIFPSYPR